MTTLTYKGNLEGLRKFINHLETKQSLKVEHKVTMNPLYCTDKYGTCEEGERCNCGDHFMTVNGHLKKIYHE